MAPNSQNTEAKSLDNPSLSVLWSEHKNFKFHVNEKFKGYDQDIESLRDYLKELDEKSEQRSKDLDQKIENKFDSINKSITNLTLTAMDAMPKWAVESSSRKDTMINGLFLLVGSLLAALATIWATHHT